MERQSDHFHKVTTSHQLDFAMKRLCAAVSSNHSDDESDDTAHTTHPHFSADIKTLCLSLLRGEGKTHAMEPMAASELAEYVGAPDRRTLSRWNYLASETAESIVTNCSSVDHRSLLGPQELKIIGGFLLFRLKTKHPPHIIDVVTFVKLAFNLSVQSPWVSRHVHSLGFSRHRPQSLLVKYAKKDNLDVGIGYLQQIQNVCLDLPDEAFLVAMDQIAFWDNGMSVSCYGVLGGCVWLFFVLTSHSPIM
jgi:hypothetical protein